MSTTPRQSEREFFAEADRLGRLHLPRTVRSSIGVVYFIQCNGASGPIKIGVTRSLAKRFKALRMTIPYPLQLLALTNGGRERENQLHERFAAYRLTGEWFSPAPELVAFIKQLGEGQ